MATNSVAFHNMHAGAVVGNSDYNEEKLSTSLTEVSCFGNEQSLIDCTSVQFSMCRSVEDADVVCQSKY